MAFGWLHVTDLHRGMSLQGCLWPNIEKQFYSDLEHVHAKCGPWHVIFFSGDLVQKGSAAEFKKLNETLGRLYKKLNSLGSNPVLVSVPGNHDLARPNRDEATVRDLSKWNEDPAIRSEFWSAGDSKFKHVIKQAFRNYTTWERRHAFPRPTRL